MNILVMVITVCSLPVAEINEGHQKPACNVQVDRAAKRIGGAQDKVGPII